jgi:hypothetical protein
MIGGFQPLAFQPCYQQDAQTPATIYRGGPPSRARGAVDAEHEAAQIAVIIAVLAADGVFG